MEELRADLGTSEKSIESWIALTDSGEAELPHLVAVTAHFFHSKGIWHIPRRNDTARSCRDAAWKRMRLGSKGIPLSDELKTFAGVIRSDGEKNRYVLAHTRGHQNLDMGKLRAALGARQNIERLGEKELLRLGMDYGTVNPFVTSNGEDTSWIQVFDLGLQECWGLPGTMMTNAGEATWAVEFYCGDLIHALPSDDVLVADIVDDSTRGRAPVPMSIGIITGNSPDAGMFLWQRINAYVRSRYGRDFRGDISLPRVIVHSLPQMGLSMELKEREEAVWATLGSAVEELCAQNIDFLALACNTTHYYGPRIEEACAKCGVQFVSMGQVAHDWVTKNSVRELALVGIPPVAEFGKWSVYRDLKDVTKIEPIDEATLNLILDLGYQVKKEGISESGLQRLRAILHQHVHTKFVLIALTEISNLLEVQRKAGRSGKVLVDVLALYAERIADLYMLGHKPFRTEAMEPPKR